MAVLFASEAPPPEGGRISISLAANDPYAAIFRAPAPAEAM